MNIFALYVLPNGDGIVPLNTRENTPHVDPSRMFASVWGAGNHPDAPPVTPLEKPIEAEYVYPCGIRAAYTIDRGPENARP